MGNLYEMIEELKGKNNTLYESVRTYNKKVVQNRIEIERNKELIERAEAVKEIMRSTTTSERGEQEWYGII